MKIVEQIASIPLFHGLHEDQIESVAMIVTDQVFKRGEIIFSEGDESNGFYVALTGRVKVYKLSYEGKEQILHIFGPGEPFGEVPVFTGESFPASAEALGESRILFFPRAAFVDLIQKDPSLAMNMLAVLSRRLRRFTNLVEDLSLKEVPGRLAAYLIYLRQRQGDKDQLTLDISKGQLASLLGTIPETLSRILSRLSGAGIIRQKNGRSIRILDDEALEDLASGARRLS
jgi:CRP/FNR family transcriptional regulator